MEDKELLEMPIEIINPGNGLPDAPPCAPFSCPGVCREPDYIISGVGGCSVLNVDWCQPAYKPPYP